MKIFIQSTNELEEKTEKEVESINEALVQQKTGEKIHICRHDEGLPCSLV